MERGQHDGPPPGETESWDLRTAGERGAAAELVGRAERDRRSEGCQWALADGCRAIRRAAVGGARGATAGSRCRQMETGSCPAWAVSVSGCHERGRSGGRQPAGRRSVGGAGRRARDAAPFKPASQPPCPGRSGWLAGAQPRRAAATATPAAGRPAGGGDARRRRRRRGGVVGGSPGICGRVCGPRRPAPPSAPT